MKITETGIRDLVIIEPRVFEDERGYFFESYNQKTFNTNYKKVQFVQDNEAKSNYGVLRGLHYQTGETSQAKLVRVLSGRVIDIAVDIREGSPTYGQWRGIELSGENKKQFFVPRGFAHGYVVLSDEAVFSYKCDNLYSKETEGGLYFDDPALKIDWQVPTGDVILSEKDKVHPTFGQHKKSGVSYE